MRCRYLLVVLVVVVAACAARPIARENAPVAKSASATAGSIHARAIYLERMAMPAGATLDLQLLGERGEDPAAIDVVARQSFGRLQGPPYEVDLAYAPERIRAGTQYSLRASLRDAEGHLRFATQSRVPVIPGNPAAVEFRLTRVDMR